MFKRPEKIISKYYRIRMTDSIKEMLQSLPIRNLEESQVGNFVYAGKGEMKIGGRYFPTYVHIKLVQGSPQVYIKSPEAKISVSCPFDTKKTGGAVETAIRRSLN